MLIPIVPTKYQKRPAKPKKPRSAPGPVALTLVAATYNEGLWVRLTFDRAIAVGSLNPSQVTVNDGQMAGTTLEGVFPATLLNPTTIEIELSEIGPSSGNDIVLSATASTGVVAVNDGAAWAGAVNVILPFG